MVGLGYNTSVVFGYKNINQLTTTQLNLVKMNVVLSWICIAIGIIYAIIRKRELIHLPHFIAI